MSIHSNRVFINWLIGVLQAGGLTVGHGARPATIPAGAGYAVVYSIAGGITRGSIDDPRSDVEANVQVTSWSTDDSDGADINQALWVADKVRTLLEAAVPATLTGGRKVIWFDYQMSSPSTGRDDQSQPPGWYAVDRFEFGVV